MTDFTTGALLPAFLLIVPLALALWDWAATGRASGRMGTS